MNRTGYRADKLEAALMKRFRQAMTPAHIERLTKRVNGLLAEASRVRDGRAE